MKRRLLGAVVAGGLLASALTGGALAHSAPPCNDSGDPGNSDYARHHIVSLATVGGLGADGHVPGTHHGFSICL